MGPLRRFGWLALLAGVSGCRACHCPDVELDEDCALASISVGGLAWENGVTVELQVNGEPAGVVGCLDLPDQAGMLPCTVEDAAPHEIDAHVNRTGPQDNGFLVSIEVEFLGLEETPTQLRADFTLPDGSETSEASGFQIVDSITDPNPTSETCPDRRCFYAVAHAGWDDPSVEDDGTTGG